LLQHESSYWVKRVTLSSPERQFLVEFKTGYIREFKKTTMVKQAQQFLFHRENAGLDAGISTSASTRIFTTRGYVWPVKTLDPDYLAPKQFRMIG